MVSALPGSPFFPWGPVFPILSITTTKAIHCQGTQPRCRDQSVLLRIDIHFFSWEFLGLCEQEQHAEREKKPVIDR